MNTVREAALAEIGDKPRRTIAERAGISEAQLSRFLSGDVKEPTLGFVSRLEAGLELRPGTLLRAGGYVEDAVSVREAIESDPRLPAEYRPTVLRIYDALATIPATDPSPSGSKSARTAKTRPSA